MPVSVGPSTLTINRDDRFIVSQPDGTITPTEDAGFFARDTRFISLWRVTINGRQPVLLSANTVEHFSSRREFTTPELPFEGGMIGPSEPGLPERSIGLRVDRTISEGVHEDYDLWNYAPTPVRVVLEIQLESDFADIFDVRWHRLVRRGEIQASWHPDVAELRTIYRNGDFYREFVARVERPGSLPQYANGRLVFLVELPPKATWHTCLHWLPIVEEGRRPTVIQDCSALEGAEAGIDTEVLPPVRLESEHPVLPAIWRRAVRDMEALRMRQHAMEESVYVPAAGIPWYVTLFGRDSLIVSMEAICGFPEFAWGALEELSHYQATDDDPEHDREPGKIPHELRFGELASLNLLPFAPYYGTHDATALYLIVLSYAYQWSGDRALLDRYRANAEAALGWLLGPGDRDRDGFQEYASRSTRGLYNQGWKDSGVAIQHEDGRIASVPLALCELQGYAFDALRRMAEVFRVWGDDERAAELESQAKTLYERFNDAFWWEAEGTYYLGLDGEKNPIRTVASNAGHCLASGIVPPERAGRVVDRLMADDMFSGWGIRTLSSDHVSYNPFSYHLGSVWPHENATIAGGFRRAGRDVEAGRVAEGIFAAAERFAENRLPELFAGLPRGPGALPVPYLGANVPQAWAAASVFRFIAILCGIHASAADRTIRVNPALPPWLPSVTLHNLRAGTGAAVLRFRDDAVDVLENSTGFTILATGSASGASKTTAMPRPRA